MPAKISDNALVVLKGRYLKKDIEGNVIETPEGHRVTSSYID